MYIYTVVQTRNFFQFVVSLFFLFTFFCNGDISLISAALFGQYQCLQAWLVQKQGWWRILYKIGKCMFLKYLGNWLKIWLPFAASFLTHSISIKPLFWLLVNQGLPLSSNFCDTCLGPPWLSEWLVENSFVLRLRILRFIM